MDQPQDRKPVETLEMIKERVALAQREHDRADRGSAAMFPAVAGFAVEAVKAAALVNGGSAAAMLAFIGTGRQPVTADTILGLKLFGLGLLAATVVSALAYLTQYFYLSAMNERLHIWEHPFIEETVASRRAVRLAIGFHLTGIFLVLASYGCAVAALLLVAGGLVPLPART